MKYVKPTANLALITASAAGTTTCTYVFTPDELEMFEMFYGVDFKDPSVFNLADACSNQVDLDMYCKFTSSDGVTKAFVS